MIETKRLLIRPMIEEDYIEMYEYMSREDVLKYDDLDPFTKEGLREFIKSTLGDPCFYAVILKETNKLIGHLYFGLNRANEHIYASLGYIFNPKYYNQGYCSEAAKAMVNYGFIKMNVYKVEAGCNPENIPSWRVMEKIGMHSEGLQKRKESFENDEDGNPIFRSGFKYTMLKEDWIKE